MKLPEYDINKRLVCPNCNKSDGVGSVWSGGNSYFGIYEEDFVCSLCKCEFTAVYKVADIKIIEKGEKTNVC